MMMTVAKMEIQFMRKVKSKYLAIKGRTSEVGGRILDTSSRNTTNDSKIDMPRVTFSPAITKNERPEQITASGTTGDGNKWD